MYKAKLQEHCQKQKWALPKYTCVRDGEDHCPQFKASVMVGGATFATASACTSLKHAYNEAAKVAFLHFTTTSEPLNQKSEDTELKNSNNELHNSTDVHPSKTDVAVKQGENHDQFKKKLEIYARRKNLALPVYNTEKVGLCFRGSLVIGENLFGSGELYETVEEAENGAAQAALLALSTEALHVIDASSYKNLLQELTQEEGFLLPTYATTESNNPHDRTFSSTVEVEGEAFQGAAAKTKKLAELNAAKAAYTVLMDRKLFQPGHIAQRASRDEVLKLSPCLNSLAISDQPKAPKPKMTSYLLCNRFKVFTSIPDAPLPDGLVLLPISEDQWTLVSLEFPREKGV